MKDVCVSEWVFVCMCPHYDKLTMAIRNWDRPQHHVWTDEWVNGWTDGWMGLMDEWMDG